jgi:hypothetical protein
MPDYNPIIDKLMAKTVEGTLAWNPSYEEDTFIAALEGVFTFQVGMPKTDAVTFVMKDSNDNKLVEMICYDVPPYQRREGYNEYYEKVAALYEEARVVALDVNSKLAAAQGLLDALSLTIRSARYGARDSWSDVAEILRTKIQAGRLRVAVTNEELGGDPIVGAPKTLEVTYAVGAKVYDKSLLEGETLSIP